MNKSNLKQIKTENNYPNQNCRNINVNNDIYIYRTVLIRKEVKFIKKKSSNFELFKIN